MEKQMPLAIIFSGLCLFLIGVLFSDTKMARYVLWYLQWSDSNKRWIL